jgi:hypothetical protein
LRQLAPPNGRGKFDEISWVRGVVTVTLGPPIPGQFHEWEYPISIPPLGVVDVIEVAGWVSAQTTPTHLFLDDFMVFPRKGHRAWVNQLGTKAVLSYLPQFLADVKQMGFSRVTISYTRVTGANPNGVATRTFNC